MRLGRGQVHAVHDGHRQQVGRFGVSARTPCKAFLFGKRRTGRSEGLPRQSQERRERGRDEAAPKERKKEGKKINKFKE